MEISNLFNRLEKVAFHFYGILGGNATGAKKIEKIQKRSGGGDVRGSVFGLRGRTVAWREKKNSEFIDLKDIARQLENLLDMGGRTPASRTNSGGRAGKAS